MLISSLQVLNCPLSTFAACPVSILAMQYVVYSHIYDRCHPIGHLLLWKWYLLLFLSLVTQYCNAYHKQFPKNTKNIKLLTFIEKKFEILYHIKAFQRDASLAVFVITLWKKRFTKNVFKEQKTSPFLWWAIASRISEFLFQKFKFHSSNQWDILGNFMTIDDALE